MFFSTVSNSKYRYLLGEDTSFHYSPLLLWAALPGDQRGPKEPRERWPVTGINEIYSDLMGFNGIYNDLMGFNGIYNDLMGFNGIYNDLMGCNEIYNDLMGY